MNDRIVDIRFRGEGLSRRLSNLFPYPFIYDGIGYASMEAFFGTIRTPDEQKKKNMLDKSGFLVWGLGHQSDWKVRQVVYYKGREIDRHSVEYDELINGAFDALFGNYDFRNALRESAGCKLMHSIGKSDKRKTLLTKREFVSQLYRLRNRLNERRFYDLNALFVN